MSHFKTVVPEQYEEKRSFTKLCRLADDLSSETKSAMLLLSTLPDETILVSE